MKFNKNPLILYIMCLPINLLKLRQVIFPFKWDTFEDLIPFLEAEC